MSEKKPSLGRGLNALGLNALLDGLDTSSTTDARPQQLHELPLTHIQPGSYQPRHHIEPEPLSQLADSIRAQGVIQPIIVRKTAPQHYAIIAGERRWRAAQQAGLTTIPALIDETRSDVDTAAIALIENIQRADLNPMEKAHALNRLVQEKGLSHQQIATLIGQSRATVSNLIRLLALDPSVRTWLKQGNLEMGHARALLTLTPKQQKATAQHIIKHNLSVRAAERYVRQQAHCASESPNAPDHQKKAILWTHNVRALQEKLQKRWNTKVEIKPSSQQKGTITIHYHNLTDLEQWLDRPPQQE